MNDQLYKLLEKKLAETEELRDLIIRTMEALAKEPAIPALIGRRPRAPASQKRTPIIQRIIEIFYTHENRPLGPSELKHFLAKDPYPEDVSDTTLRNTLHRYKGKALCQPTHGKYKLDERSLQPEHDREPTDTHSDHEALLSEESNPEPSQPKEIAHPTPLSSAEDL